MEYVRRFTAHNPLGQSVSILQWNRPIKDNRFGVDAMAYMKGGNYSILGANLYKFDATTFIGLFDKFDSFYTKNSTLSASILILERFPNTITKRVPDEATAYSYHDALGYMKDARSLLIIIHRAESAPEMTNIIFNIVSFPLSSLMQLQRLWQSSLGRRRAMSWWPRAATTARWRCTSTMPTVMRAKWPGIQSENFPGCGP